MFDKYYSYGDTPYTWNEEQIKKDTIETTEDYYSVYNSNQFDTNTNSKLKDKLSYCAYNIYNDLNAINLNIKKKFLEKKWIDNMNDKVLIEHYLFLNLQTNTLKSLSFLKKELLNNKKISIFFILKYLDSKNIEESKIIEKYLIDNLHQYTGVELGNICFSLKNQGISKKIFQKVSKLNKKKSVHVFHALIEKDLFVAEEIAKEYIEKKDSILRKGIIGLLVRHNSALGQKHIEKLFTGSKPRIIGLHFEQYQNTNAVEEYKYISRHDYLEVGKEFPPIYCDEPLKDEIILWKKFIKKYPTFPATDDAYYRLIFRLVLERRIKEARYFIKQYEHNDFPDTDATDSILEIKKLISRRKISKVNFYLKVENCKERNIF